MADPAIYTVGWISAVSTEYVAARTFLDKEHDRPECVSNNDNNDYTLGQIGRHNVVMAVLPSGEYGIATAASVARNMMTSFPNVRFGLLVGIGGGVPSPRHDIRLGDVVVSAPPNGGTGVFQYDFGDSIQNSRFKATGFLDQSPTVLRTAVNGLRADYEMRGHDLQASATDALQKFPRLKKRYKQPDPASDKLYRSDYLHRKGDASCATACGDDPSCLVPRAERSDDEDTPTIHHGLVASANRLMMNAVMRDRLAEEKDVLCFEMEAAGLANHFPCLVVRGIT